MGPLRLNADDAQRFTEQIEDLHTSLRKQMTFAQASYEKYAKGEAPPLFKPRDQVWLNDRNIRTERPAKKLDFKNLGPFEIIEQINLFAYRLRLPPTIKVHNVFYVNLLRPTSKRSPLPRQEAAREPPPAIEVEREDEDAQLKYKVSEVVDSGIRKRKDPSPDGKRDKVLHYRVYWTGYTTPT